MKRCMAIKCCLAIFTMLFLVQSAFAIGTWSHGRVTRTPWYANTYQYIVVDNTRYTIMKEAIALEVVEKGGADYKSGIAIQDIRRGDQILIQVEGNRIYQIEILR